MLRLAPLPILLAACSPSMVACPAGQYVDENGLCVKGTTDDAPSPGDDDDDDTSSTGDDDDDDDDDDTTDGIDGDGDGYIEDDCDDSDPDVNPGVDEDPDNGIDDDCDRSIDELDDSLDDLVVDPNTSTTCDSPSSRSAYEGIGKRYIPVRIIRVGLDNTANTPSVAECQAGVAKANQVLTSAKIELFVAAEETLHLTEAHELEAGGFATLRGGYPDDGMLHVFVVGDVTDSAGDPVHGLAAAPGGSRNHGLAIGVDHLESDRSLAQLVGHALGLDHTHAGTADGSAPEPADGDDCDLTGDLLCDTPADPGPSWAFPDGCAVDPATCSVTDCGVDADGTPYDPDPDNVMSAYPDGCGTPTFTADQAAHMACSADLDLPGVDLLEEPTFGPDITVGGHEIDDDNAGASSGDNDGVMELGETVQIHVDLSNTGLADASSVVATLTDNQADVVIDSGTDTLGNLAQGGTTTATFVASVPASCNTDNTTTFTVEVEDGTGQSWTDSFDVPVVCDAGVDLQAVAADVVGGTIAPGNTVDFELTVRNNSLIPLSGVEADLYLSSDTTLSPATDVFVCSYTAPGSLAAGATGTLTATCTVPASLGTGTWYFGYDLDPDDVHVEVNEGNNRVVDNGSSSVSDPPDLTVSVFDLTGPTTLVAGADLEFDLTTTNLGGDALDHEVGVYLSTDGTVTTSDTRICHLLPAPLAGGASEAGAYFCTLPTTLASGTWTVGAIVDDLGDVSESNEGNNSRVAGTIQIVDDIDLEPSNVVLQDTSGWAGDTFAVDFDLTNHGALTSPAVDLAVLFSDNSTVTTLDTFACLSNTVVEPPGNHTEPLVLSGCPVPDLAPGDYWVGVYLDDSESIDELDETNNIGTASNRFTVLGRDLTVSNVAPQVTSGAAGSTVGVDYIRENIGNADSGAFRLSIRWSTNTTITDTDPEGCFTTISNSAGGDYVDAAINACTVPSGLASGDYYVGVMMDALDEVEEWDESNNTAASTVLFTVP